VSSRNERLAFPVDDGGAEAADGVGEIDGVGLAEIFWVEYSLDRGWPLLKKMKTVDSGEQAGFNWRRDEIAILFNEEVVDRSFGDLASLVEEEDIVKAGFDGGFELGGVEGAVGCFVEVHGVAGIGSLGCEADSQRLGAVYDCGGWQEFTFDLEIAVVG
jgi:hypothetical protein